jgi:hypothetical protein
LGDESTSVDGQRIPELQEDDDRRREQDFIEYLNERFCGYNGS